MVEKGFKQTEVGLIPNDWNVRKIGECLLINPDYGINAAAVPYNENLPAYLRITDITDDGNYSKKNLVSVNNTSSSSYFLQEGDLVFARTGASVGKTYLYNPKDGKLVFAGFLIRVRVNEEVLLPTYLKYFTQTKCYWDWITANSMRTGQPGINGNEYKELHIPLPPTKAEQTAIATVLNDTDALIQKLEQLIAKKRNIKTAAMQELLRPKEGWVVKKLGEVFTFLPTANNSRSDLLEEGEINYIHYGDIHTKWKGFIDCSKAKIPFIEKEKIKSLPFLSNGDLLVADASEDYEGLGECVEIKNIGNKKIVAGLHTLLLRGNSAFITVGFRGYLKSFFCFQQQLIANANGVSVYGISKNSLRSCELHLPSLSEQTRIAQILSDMDNEIQQLEKQLEKYKKLKQGMMQSLLTGRIRLNFDS